MADSTSVEQLCAKSTRGDGGHSWHFDGDDPYIVCVFCDEVRDAINGRVIRAAIERFKPAAPAAPEPPCIDCMHEYHGEDACEVIVSYDAGVAGPCGCRTVPAAPVEATRTAEDEARRTSATLDLGHDDEIMAAFALYDPLVGRIVTPEQQTEAINRRAMARGHVIATIANAAYEVAQSDFEDTHAISVEAEDLLLFIARLPGHEHFNPRDFFTDCRACLAIEMRADDARVRASLPSNSDRLREALDVMAWGDAATRAAGATFSGGELADALSRTGFRAGTAWAWNRITAALAESSASTTRPPLKKGNAQKVDR